MPVTSNVAWDERLEAFKGRDTPGFVALLAAAAGACAECGRALQPAEPLSLVVDIIEGRAGGIEYLTVGTCICHRRCREPGLALHTAAGAPEELKARGGRLLLRPRDGSGARAVPVLAYTLVPVLTFREPGGELTSALVSVLLSHGFELALGTGYADILREVRDVHNSVRCTVTDQGLLCLLVGAEQMYSQQFHPADARDAAWLQAATHEGKVLLISGDYLAITGTGLNLDAAAALGTLVTGNVPVQT